MKTKNECVSSCTQALMVILITVMISSCGKPTTTCPDNDITKFGGSAYITERLSCSTAPGQQVMSILFELVYRTKDTLSLKKDLAIEFPLIGKSGDIKVKHDIRYAVKLDTTETLSINIAHLSKNYSIVEGQTKSIGELKSYSFIETIPCDSIGTEKYLLQIRMKNKVKGHDALLQIDSWDSEILKN